MRAPRAGDPVKARRLLGIAPACLLAFAIVVSLSGCAGGSGAKTAEPSGEAIERSERNEEAAALKQEEAAETERNRALLSALESKGREAAADAKARHTEEVAEAKAKKREAAAALAIKHKEEAAEANAKKREAAEAQAKKQAQAKTKHLKQSTSQGSQPVTPAQTSTQTSTEAQATTTDATG